VNERCIDAGVIVKLALKGESHRITTRRLVRESTAAGIELIAPFLFESEVDTVIRKRVVAGKLALRTHIKPTGSSTVRQSKSPPIPIYVKRPATSLSDSTCLLFTMPPTRP
jgi:predicted nucleic acid-binding protein